MASGFSQSGERIWSADEVPANAAPFAPLALRVRDPRGKVSDTLLARDPIEVEVEYRLDQDVTALRVGIYLMTLRGEVVFTSFDTDDPKLFDKFGGREAGTYISRTQIPADLLNEGQYVLGINASAFRIKSYFTDERALSFTVDAMGAAGMHWGETRQGPIRPQLDWAIKRVKD
jgi:lipopolysaccharide transport system ATP-binding protein